MAKTNKLLNRTGNARPYIQRALTDEELRQNVRNAFDSVRDVYKELLGGRGPVKLGARVATDTEIQERLKEAIAELREAAERIQGKKEHGARNSFLLLTGITLGVLFAQRTSGGGGSGGTGRFPQLGPLGPHHHTDRWRVPGTGRFPQLRPGGGGPAGRRRLLRRRRRRRQDCGALGRGRCDDALKRAWIEAVGARDVVGGDQDRTRLGRL